MPAKKTNQTSDAINATSKQEVAVAAKVGFPIVGIGASAGGLAAFESFFSAIPDDTGLGIAYVIVQHLSPDHKSILTELVQRYTSMHVYEVEDGMKVVPNCTYIIPPNYDMAIVNGSLQLLQPSKPRSLRLPVDFFFRSLANDQGRQSIAIILSGTGSDGSLGVRAIKDAGGMVMVQSPETTEFDGMPRSALSTGTVDFVLTPSEMPKQLIEYVATNSVRLAEPFEHLPKAESALKKIFAILRLNTGHDFSHYKQNTISRRIERRMSVQQLTDLDEYVKYLQHTPMEVEALFRDMLIGVTSFFRDTEAFKALETEAIPEIFRLKRGDDTIRVWTVGCSTGEEAYSIAMLLQEQMEALKISFKVQIFATDIDAQAIATARTGLYPSNIKADVLPERLSRFFTCEPGGAAYRIHKSIRDMLIFSVHNVTKDPPFSRLDIISCRNLMIYMDVELQRRIIPAFHYSLNSGGILFLGSAEGIGEFEDMFSAVNRKQKIFQRKVDGETVCHSVFSPPHLLPMSSKPNLRSSGHLAPAKLPLRQLTEDALLDQLGVVGALVNAKGDIFWLHGRTGRYLEPAPGEATVNNILKMAKEGLKYKLSTAMHQAITTKSVVVVPSVQVKNDEHFISLRLTIRPVIDGIYLSLEAPLYLVMFEELHPASLPAGLLALSAHTALTKERAEDETCLSIRQDLEAKEAYLQSVLEELETSNEEMQSLNEELQSANEELQSTNEELETSKEELQSVNEELSTVNAELRDKVDNLSQANNDMNNLLAGTGIGTVFVDYQLRILRFTPAVSSIINLIQGDMGRPVSHIVSNFVGYDRMVADTKAVLDSLIPKQIDVQTKDGKWYMMRILPYRTLGNVIEGAVITFVDITELKEATAALKKAHYQASVVRDAYDAVIVQDLGGLVTAWNAGAARMYGYSEEEALGMSISDRAPEPLKAEALLVIAQLSQNGKSLEPYLTERLAKDGSTLHVWVKATALINERGAIYAITTSEWLDTA